MYLFISFKGKDYFYNKTMNAKMRLKLDFLNLSKVLQANHLMIISEEKFQSVAFHVTCDFKNKKCMEININFLCKNN